jgi:hypothetical protein
MVRKLARYSIIAAVCLTALISAPLVTAQDAQRGPGGPGGGWMMGGNGSPPVAGTVTAVGASDLTLKTGEGEVYKVTYSVNTRFMKDRQPAKSGDVKVGDTVIAAGVVDAKAKSVAAAFVAELDPEQAKRIHEAQANYGKTWLGGKIAGIDETKLTITGMDGKPATFIVDENTSFKKRRDSITLADVKVGDRVRVEGAVKGGTFVASTLSVFEPRPEGERGPREGMGAPGAASPIPQN